MSVLHIMHGFIGSGKTTFSKWLEVEKRALRMNNDEWMVALFGHNPQQQRFNDNYQAIEVLQWRIIERVLALGLDVVFDNGSWSRSARDALRTKAASLGVPVLFYMMDVPKEEMWRRVDARNANLPSGSLLIELNTFEGLWQRYQPMGSNEEKIVVTGDYRHVPARS